MTLDITGENARKLLYIEDLFKALMEKYNYQYIKTPTLEDEQSVFDPVLTIINNRTKEEFKIEEEYIINFLDEKVSGEDEEDIY